MKKLSLILAMTIIFVVVKAQNYNIVYPGNPPVNEKSLPYYEKIFRDVNKRFILYFNDKDSIVTEYDEKIPSPLMMINDGDQFNIWSFKTPLPTAGRCTETYPTEEQWQADSLRKISEYKKDSLLKNDQRKWFMADQRTTDDNWRYVRTVTARVLYRSRDPKTFDVVWVPKEHSSFVSSSSKSEKKKDKKVRAKKQKWTKSKKCPCLT